MTAVFEAMALKLVFATMPCSSFPSHSPARARSFLNAAVEWGEARSVKAAMNVKKTSGNTSLRQFMNFLPRHQDGLRLLCCLELTIPNNSDCGLYVDDNELQPGLYALTHREEEKIAAREASRGAKSCAERRWQLQ